MTSLAGWVADTFGYEFKDQRLLALALTHRSAASFNNERLEFLGDAVLNVVISERLYRQRPSAAEGALSRLRASVVSGATLSEVGAQIGLGDWLNLGPGELKSGGYRRGSILENTLEALLGAIYLDGGHEAAAAVIDRLFGERLHNLPPAAELKDPKTRLQEWLQSQGLPLPDYSIESVSGEPHQQTFTVTCAVEQLRVAGQGQGRSRRLAEQAAAERVLSSIEA